MRATHRDITRDNPHIRFELLDCPECIYLNEHGRCRLRKSICDGGKCLYQKSAAAENASYEKWRNRLQGLSEQRQSEIANKYFGGKYPWREDKRRGP